MLSENLPRAIHESMLVVAGHSIRCYVLDNGMRMFDADDIEAFFKPAMDADALENSSAMQELRTVMGDYYDAENSPQG